MDSPNPGTGLVCAGVLAGSDVGLGSSSALLSVSVADEGAVVVVRFLG